MLYIYYSNQLWLSGQAFGLLVPILLCALDVVCCALEQGTKSALWLVQLTLGTDLNWAGAPS